jgi:hypothetical protein
MLTTFCLGGTRGNAVYAVQACQLVALSQAPFRVQETSWYVSLFQGPVKCYLGCIALLGLRAMWFG